MWPTVYTVSLCISCENFLVIFSAGYIDIPVGHNLRQLLGIIWIELFI